MQEIKNMSTTKTIGVLYLAFGSLYHEEAKASIKSLLEKNPTLSVAVFTDNPYEFRNFNPNVTAIYKSSLENSKGKTRVKPTYLIDTPFDRTLYLDTDTRVLGDITKIFNLLNHYDIGVRFGGPKSKYNDNLYFHPQCNSGVVIYEKNEKIYDCFQLWQKLYEEAYQEIEKTEDMHGIRDQRYLSIAIALSKVRPCHLGDYLHFIMFGFDIANGPPLIVTARFSPVDAIAISLANYWKTDDWRARVWLPNIRGFLPNGVRRSDPFLIIALMFRRIWNEVKFRILRYSQRRKS